MPRYARPVTPTHPGQIPVRFAASLTLEAIPAPVLRGTEPPPEFATPLEVGEEPGSPACCAAGSRLNYESPA